MVKISQIKYERPDKDEVLKKLADLNSVSKTLKR